MVCIYCGSPTKTNNSRPTRSGHQVWRRKSCKSCRAVFTTRESADLAEAIRVQTTEKALEAFQRDKLLISLYRSLSHRKTALKDAGELVDTVMQELIPLLNRGVINTAIIAKCVQTILERFDHAAAVYYKAHYQIVSTS